MTALSTPAVDVPLGPNDPEGMLFGAAFAGLGVDADLLVPWSLRAVEIDAQPFAADRGIAMLQTLWAQDRFMRHLDEAAILGMQRYLNFATVAPGSRLIKQDEYGNFMVVVLCGSIAVDRIQPWGEQLRLAETRPGEILGEMSLLDSGIRFSACNTLTPCQIAVLSADGMDDMLQHSPPLAANLVALLARKLSLRLRVVSARLSDTQADQTSQHASTPNDSRE